MMFRYKIRNAATLMVLGVMSMSTQLSARENIVTAHHKDGLKTSATKCLPATASIDLDINNVRARLMTGGDMWWDIGQQVAAYEVPKGSGKSSQFAASCWIGGFDQQKQLKVAAQTYRQDGNDYWPGVLDGSGQVTADACTQWDRFWKVDRTTINKFIELYKTGGVNAVQGKEFDAINQWPGTGNGGALGSNGTNLKLSTTRAYAPFKDLNGDNIYEPGLGEYPLITGDEYIWWVFNDAGNVKLQSGTAAIGVEVQTSAFAYSTQDFLNNATFCQYRVINYGQLTIDSTYIAVWDDCDLGYAFDDFIGCDTSRGLGIQYNGTNDDGGGAGGHPVNSYGLNPPQVGLDFFQGPKRIYHRPGMSDSFSAPLKMSSFTYYNNDASIIGNPTNGIQIYNYMTGSIRDGERFSYDYQGPGTQSRAYGAGPVFNFAFCGDPGIVGQWSECACNNSPGDRRFIFSSGPFQLIPGAKNENDIVFGCIWAAQLGGCPVGSFTQIKAIDDQAQALFDENFKTVEGPEAPRLVVRELDQRLIFYMVNDYGSNNFGENYGRSDGKYNDSLQYHQPVAKAKSVSTDTLYHFEGYRVFQLANGQVTSADIFDPTTGEVDPTKAYEVFQCDIHDSVTTLVNYVKNMQITAANGSNPWIPQVKVTGKDSGIVHSFELTQDQFATAANKTFINYHSYYFVAIAYAQNNFQPFDPSNPSDKAQDKPYVGSAHGAAGSNIIVVSAMPNPTNGALGNVLNADFGSGVSIHRIEGQGNGGNLVQLDSASEVSGVINGKVDDATYLPDQGPINVKIVDPVIVPAYDWVLQIKDTSSAAVSFGATWMLTAKKDNVAIDTIYSETNINNLNEQIIEKYGISVSLQQHYAPSQAPVAAPANQKVDNNGFVASDITFDNPAYSWLNGVQDQSDSNFSNWIRSGASTNSWKTGSPCDFNDNGLDLYGYYENMFSNFSPTKSTWAPYNLAASWTNKHTGNGAMCAMEVSYSNTKTNISMTADMKNLPDVNLVFTNDKSLWTRCAVIEMQEDSNLAQGHAVRFSLRRHKGWNGQMQSDGLTPIYSESDSDAGMSWFPGYAIDEGTGKRLNIVFGEDSYLSSDGGNDMLWNPSSRWANSFDGTTVFGGQHITYILNSAYDKDRAFDSLVTRAAINNNVITYRQAYTPFSWVGIPLTSRFVPMKSYGDGYIPTRTTLRFRVTRPYAPYLAVKNAPADTLSGIGTFPYYTFSTKDLAPTLLSDTTNRSALLSKIYAVPNPYYGYSGYEVNRYDTKVRIINLPAKTTINIYALDGSLVRTLSKNDPNVSYIDWDIRNSIGLPIASGMYLMDVKAEGIGETVVKWFGATRPIDVTNY